MQTPPSVEIRCARCAGSGNDPFLGSGGSHRLPRPDHCHGCGGTGRQQALVAPDSPTAAQLALADVVAGTPDADLALFFADATTEARFMAALAAARASAIPEASPHPTSRLRRLLFDPTADLLSRTGLSLLALHGASELALAGRQSDWWIAVAVALLCHQAVLMGALRDAQRAQSARIRAWRRGEATSTPPISATAATPPHPADGEEAR